MALSLADSKGLDPAGFESLVSSTRVCLIVPSPAATGCTLFALSFGNNGLPTGPERFARFDA